MSTLKRILVRLLTPLARIAGWLSPLRRLWSHTRLRSQIRDLGPSAVILQMPEIHGSGSIRIGSGAYIYPGLYAETRGIGAITIGENVVISRGVHLVSRYGVTVGDGTMIGEYTSIRDANHRYDADSVRHAGHAGAAIAIGRNVWVGRGVTILPGVTIGDNAVVTKSVEADRVVVGIPASPIKQRRTA